MREDDDFQNLSVRFPFATLSLLRKAAVERAITEKTRISVGATVVALVERHLAEIEKS